MDVQALERAFSAAMAPEGNSGAMVIGVACSGGGDSVALLHLAAKWARTHGVGVQVATIDHGLRAASAAEAADVAALARRLGLSHQTLHWHWDQRGNLQSEARDARRRLLLAWARSEGIAAVLLGHTADDQAETVMMRLARGSGVDGLAGMASRSGLFLRPLLDVPRAALRDYLRAKDQVWVEDPSNDNPRFDRVKVRQMLPELAAIGLTPARLVQTAAHMARARVTLREAAVAFAARHIRAEAGDLILDPAVFQLAAGDSPARVLSAALQWLGASSYRPRYESLCDAAAALLAGQGRTLAGVQLRPGPKGVRLLREYAAIGPDVIVTNQAMTAVPLWDGRWQFTPDPAAQPLPAGVRIAALGERGLDSCPNWREAGLRRSSILTTPALWHGDCLVAAPFANFAPQYRFKLSPSFADFLLSH